jgi:hypothetical protein
MHSVPQAQERSMKMMDEFKTFAMRGNVVDLSSAPPSAPSSTRWSAMSSCR